MCLSEGVLCTVLSTRRAVPLRRMRRMRFQPQIFFDKFEIDVLAAA